MNKKSFFWGVATGIVLTFATIFVIKLVNKNSEENDPIQYLDKPVSYEKKTEASFKVLQVLGDAALANEMPDYSKVVLIMGENYYCDQIITIKNPVRIGTYSYTSMKDIPMTVPVIDGEKSE